MKILVDMNLSPEWVPVLKEQGWGAIHWSRVGKPSAPDQEVLIWARSNGHIVLTHDLDFGAILAATRGKSPSVIQLRVQDIHPRHIGNLVIRVMHQFRQYLQEGALISIDEKRPRVRILPLKE
jgi:predicted nuclease of predicted toxin-antitoxin system